MNNELNIYFLINPLILCPTVENVKSVFCFKLNGVPPFVGFERINARHTHSPQALVTYGTTYTFENTL